MSGLFEPFFRIFGGFFLEHRRKFIIFFIIGAMFVFAAVVMQTAAPPDNTSDQRTRYTQLYLQQFLAGYRTYQQDFELEDIYFGEKFLSFRLELLFKPKMDFTVRRLAGQIVSDLREEYPELELIKITFSRRSEGISYGTAVYSTDSPGITWEFK